MAYEVLARKWRPGNFATMVGQEHVLRAFPTPLMGGVSTTPICSPEPVVWGKRRWRAFWLGA